LAFGVVSRLCVGFRQFSDIFCQRVLSTFAEIAADFSAAAQATPGQLFVSAVAGGFERIVHLRDCVNGNAPIIAFIIAAKSGVFVMVNLLMG